MAIAFLISSIGHAQTRSMFYDLTKENLPANFVEQIKARRSGKALPETVTPSAAAEAPKPKASKFRDLLAGESVADVPELSKQPVQISIVPVQKPEVSIAELPSVLSCEQNGQNQCENIKYDIGTLSRPGYYKEYIQHMMPIALYMQAKTGFPAAVMIAQSIEETGSGNSGHAKYYNGLFGHTCGRSGTITNISFVADNENFTSRGSCSVRAYDPQTGKTVNYIRFDTPESSVAGYIHNVLYDKDMGRAYAGVRAAVRTARAKNPNGVATWQSVVSALGSYAENPNYRNNLSNIIRAHGLDKLEKNSCQTCIEQRENNKRKSNETTAAS